MPQNQSLFLADNCYSIREREMPRAKGAHAAVAGALGRPSVPSCSGMCPNFMVNCPQRYPAMDGLIRLCRDPTVARASRLPLPAKPPNLLLLLTTPETPPGPCPYSVDCLRVVGAIFPVDLVGRSHKGGVMQGALGQRGKGKVLVPQ